MKHSYNIVYVLLALSFVFTSFTLQAQSTYTFVFLNKRTDKPELPQTEVKDIMRGHLANIHRLAKEGKLLVAGPFEGGGGVFILNTTSTDEARAWLSTDPGIKTGRWNIEMLPFTFRTGAACPVADSVEMVTYHFVRFIPRITKFNVKNSAVTLHEHDSFIRQLGKTGNVIAEGIFSEQNGSVLVLKGEVAREVIAQSPGVEATLFDFEMKELWVGRGAFCEE